MWLPSKKQQAFTMIELLVTASVMVVLLTIGIINYLAFLNKQRLYQEGSAIEAVLKDARSKAQNGFLGEEAIGFCDKLAAIEVFSESVDNQLQIKTQMACANGANAVQSIYQLDHNEFNLDQSFRVAFLPLRGANIFLNGNAVASGSASLSFGNDQVIFNFDQGGSIDVQYQ